MRFSTRAIHAGQPADPSTGATIVPIYQTATFTQAGIGEEQPYEYSRTANPTRTALEECLAALDEGRHGLAFASGSAATAAVMSLPRPGDHVVAADDLYGGTYRYFERVLRPQGVTITYVDGRSPAEFEAAFGPATRVAWLETPTNPLLQLVDIEAVAALARPRGILVAVDNTFATSFLQKPLALGADIVVYSTTKYVAGHSDVVGGAVVVNDAGLHEQIKFHQNAAGAVPGPFDAWLTLRGVKTLALRMARHSANAGELARYLREHPQVRAVHYPGLPDHPQHALAARQMSDFGGMVTLQLAGGREEADRFVRSLRLFSYAESLGGVESLVCHPATMTHASIPAADREKRGITEGTLRLSVGIEDIADLRDDVDTALRRVSAGA